MSSWNQTEMSWTEMLVEAISALFVLGILFLSLLCWSAITPSDIVVSKIIVGFVVYFVALYPVMAIVEYVAHRWFMHRYSVINKLGYQAHRIEHHGNGENDDWPHIRLRLRDHLLYGSPAVVWLVCRGLFGFTYAFGGVAALLLWFFIYVRVYSALHRTHHDLEHNWTERLPGAEAMKQHHLLHHKYPKTNFAVVLGVPFGFAWVDRLFGTWRSA